MLVRDVRTVLLVAVLIQVSVTLGIIPGDTVSLVFHVTTLEYKQPLTGLLCSVRGQK